MNAKVIDLPCITSLDIPPEKILKRVLEKDLESVVIMGYHKSGELYFASSFPGGGDVLWLMEKLKVELLNRG